MPTIVSDIDGTILYNGIQPIKKTIDFLKQNSSKYKVVLITARPEAKRDSTVSALRKAGVSYDRLMMNNVGPSHRDGLESKKKNISSIGKVVLAIDNDADVRSLYSSLGVKAISPSKLSANLLTKRFWQGII